jgi:hypothetical protein
LRGRTVEGQRDQTFFDHLQHDGDTASAKTGSHVSNGSVTRLATLTAQS